MSGQRSALLRLIYILYRLVARFGPLLLYPAFKVLGLAGWARRRGLFGRRPPAERLRLFLQDVGGALLKVGQIMSMRVDFLSREYISELLRLLDQVPPFDSAVARRIIEEDLGVPIAGAFRTFEDVPIAAASFGQVHAATLPNGDSVVVKVRRPGIQDTIHADLKLFRVTATLIDATGLTGRNPLRRVYDDFREWTLEEMDYRVEGSHAQEIHDCSEGWPHEKIPRVYWSHTTTRVLTLERLQGLWMKDFLEIFRRDSAAAHERLSQLKTSLEQVSTNALHNALRQIFVYGVYHADPHAANLLIMENGVIGYVDFGITGRLGGKSKEQQVRIHIALESGDFNKFYAAVLDILETPQYADLRRFQNELRRAYHRWLNAQSMHTEMAVDKSFARLMLRLTAAAQSAGVGLREAEIRIFRTLATIDALLLEIAPSLDMRGELRSFFGSYIAFRFVTYDLPRLVHSIPAWLSRLTDDIESGLELENLVFSQVRWVLGFVHQALALALTVFGVFAIFAPGVRDLWLNALHVSAVRGFALLALAALFLAWVSRWFKVHSLVPGLIPRRQRRIGDSSDERP
jgi:ubiquinone biosynthesis protein